MNVSPGNDILIRMLRSNQSFSSLENGICDIFPPPGASTEYASESRCIKTFSGTLLLCALYLVVHFYFFIPAFFYLSANQNLREPISELNEWMQQNKIDGRAAK